MREKDGGCLQGFAYMWVINHGFILINLTKVAALVFRLASIQLAIRLYTLYVECYSVLAQSIN